MRVESGADLIVAVKLLVAPGGRDAQQCQHLGSMCIGFVSVISGTLRPEPQSDRAKRV
jgi:hypothetical protein